MSEVNEAEGTPQEPAEASETDTEFAADLAAALEGSEALEGQEEPATRPRDERGRFASTKDDESDSDDGGEDGADQDDEDSPDPEQAEAEEAQPAIQAPEHWSAADKERFEKAPAELKQWLIDRYNQAESAFTPKLQEAAAAREWKQQFDAVVSPYMHLIQREGGTPISAFANLLQTAAALREGTPQQKAQLFAQMAQQFGVSIDDIDAAPVQRTDPVVQQLQQQIQHLQGGLMGFMNAQRERERETIGQAWQRFATENEFAQDVEADMARLIQSGAATGASHSDILDKAYRMALATRPDLQSKAEAKREADRRKAEEAKNKEAAERARKAKGVTVKAGGKPGRQQAKSLEQDLAEQLAALEGYS